MDEGDLKDKLQSCSEGPFHTTRYSISHRGAPLMFPEHSREGYMAAGRMGAGKAIELAKSLMLGLNLYLQA
jgi:glycerophosphoryl diester phosphodiesterase